MHTFLGKLTAAHYIHPEASCNIIESCILYLAGRSAFQHRTNPPRPLTNTDKLAKSVILWQLCIFYVSNLERYKTNNSHFN